MNQDYFLYYHHVYMMIILIGNFVVKLVFLRWGAEAVHTRGEDEYEREGSGGPLPPQTGGAGGSPDGVLGGTWH